MVPSSDVEDESSSCCSKQILLTLPWQPWSPRIIQYGCEYFKKKDCCWKTTLGHEDLSSLLVLLHAVKYGKLVDTVPAMENIKTTAAKAASNHRFDVHKSLSCWSCHRRKQKNKLKTNSTTCRVINKSPCKVKTSSWLFSYKALKDSFVMVNYVTFTQWDVTQQRRQS